MRKLLLATLLIAAPRVGRADAASASTTSRAWPTSTEPALSPDGNALVYTVSTANLAEDKTQSDLWRVGYDGQRPRPPDQHAQAQRIASAVVAGWQVDRVPVRSRRRRREDPGLDDARHAAARRASLTKFAEGVDDFVWSPDGKRLALIARDPERPAGTPKPKNPPPIVTERYQFREDGVGYLDHRRKHLYVFDIASGKADLLTPGAHDEQLPAWSPDGAPDRLRDQARRRSRPAPQLRHLRDRAEGRRAGTPAHHVHRLRPRSVLGNAPDLESGQHAHRLPAQRRGQVDLLRAVAAGRRRCCDRRRAHSRADRPLLHQAALGAGRPQHLRAGRAAAASPICRASTCRQRQGDAS